MSPLQEAIDAVMAEQWSGTLAQMDALSRLVTEARAALAQPAEPVASDPAPTVPAQVMECIQAYGDARADDDGTNAHRLQRVIEQLRAWGATLAAAPKAPQPQPTRQLMVRTLQPSGEWSERVIPPGAKVVVGGPKHVVVDAHDGNTHGEPMLNPAPQPERVPLTDEQRDALRIMLEHFGDDPRVQCLHAVAGIKSDDSNGR